MAPTFLGLAGLSKPAIFDGKSLVPLLLGAVPPGDTEEEEGQSAAVGLLLDKQDSLPPSVVEHMTGVIVRLLALSCACPLRTTLLRQFARAAG